jgi:hypothetical protein
MTPHADHAACACTAQNQEPLMPKAVRIHQFGGLENLKIENVDPGEPGPGEVRAWWKP